MIEFFQIIKKNVSLVSKLIFIEMFKKICSVHRESQLTLFCLEESCHAYRLLCSDCSNDPLTKEPHNSHSLVLIEDFIKQFEGKKEKASLPLECKHQQKGKGRADEDSKQNPNSPLTEETSKNLAAFQTLKKLMMDPQSLNSSTESVAKPESSKGTITVLTETTNICQSSQRKEVQTCMKKGIPPQQQKVADVQVLPSSKCYQPLMVLLMKENILPLGKQSGKNASNCSKSMENRKAMSSEVIVLDDKETPEECNRNIICSTPSTKLNTTANTSASNENKDLASSQPSDNSSRAGKKKRGRPKKRETEISKFEATTITNSSEVKASDLDENLPLKSKKGRKTQQTGRETKEKKKACKQDQLASIKPEAPVSVMEQLRNAISKLEGASMPNSTKVSVVKEAKASIGKVSTGKKSPFVCASDVYTEDELQVEARSFFADKPALGYSDMQQELKRQVTGFKEFCAYTLKNTEKKIKAKELKELWKELSKQDHEQWNSIALRKRIELRNQFERQNSMEQEQTTVPTTENPLKKTKA